MLRTMSRVAALYATFVFIGQTGCSSGTPSGNVTSPSAGAAAAGTSSSSGGTSTVGGGASGAGGSTTATAGMSGTGPSAGGASGGGAGGTSNGGTSNGGVGGMSTGGTSGSGGTPSGAGLGGMTNDLGTIIGSPAVAKLVALTNNCTAANKVASDTGKFSTDSGKTVHVCSLPGAAGSADAGGAIYWTADMDIDCDGVTTANCPGTGADKDPSYYYQTSFAGPNSAPSKDGPALSAEKTPYVVIPDEVTNVDQQNGGNIVAVIYQNQIEFAVFGDQIEYQPGDTNEPIGEASVRTAKGLGIPASPASGGVSGGVTYIAFTGKGTQPKDMEDVAEIQALGTKLLLSLLANNP